MELLGYMAFTILAAGSVAGAVLLAFGLRGRKVDDFPYCRKCRYNLTGLTSERCPECGSLTADVGVVMGRRQRRRKLIVAGLVLFMPSAAVLIGAQTQWARSVNWYQKLPTWWVLHDARSTSEARALRAFQELGRRAEIANLTGKDQEALAEIMLGHFMRRTSPFDPSNEIEDAAAIWIDDALERSRLSASQKEQVYARRSWVVWRARPVASLEIGIPIELGVTEYVYGDGLGAVEAQVSVDQVSMSIDGGPPVVLLNQRKSLQYWKILIEEFRLPEPFCNSKNIKDIAGTVDVGWAPPTLTWDLLQHWTVAAFRPGLYEFRLSYLYSVYPAADPRKKQGPNMPLYEQSRTIITQSQVVTVPPAQLVTTVADPQVRQEMLARLSVESVFRKPHRYLDSGGPCIEISIAGRSPLPVGIASRIVVDGAGRNAGRLYSEDGETPPANELVTPGYLNLRQHPTHVKWGNDKQWYFHFWDEHPERQQVSIIMTPDPALAASTVDVTEIFGEPIRFENVPVDPDFAAAQKRSQAREVAMSAAGMGSSQGGGSEASQPAR